MRQGNEATLSPEFLRSLLKVMANLELSEEAVKSFGLFAGLVATMNTLQPEGYSETFPALTFKLVRE